MVHFLQCVLLSPKKSTYKILIKSLETLTLSLVYMVYILKCGQLSLVYYRVFCTEIEDMSLDDLWFMQDGAPCPVYNLSSAQQTPNRVISSHDFLCWTMNDRCYANNQILKSNTIHVICELQRETIKKVLEN